MPQFQQWELKSKVLEKRCLAIEKEAAKNFSSKKASSLKDDLKKNRKEAYTKEDKFAETIPAAIKKGVTGKSWKDFQKDDDFDKAMKAWEGSLMFQQNLVKELETLSDNAKKRFQELTKELSEFEKEIKKSGESAKTNKIIKKTTDKAQEVLKELAAAKDAFGTVSSKDVFFGANIKKSKDVVVKNALKDGKGDELPDMLLEHPKRQQTDTTTKRLLRNINKHTDNAKNLCSKEKFATIPEKKSDRGPFEKYVQNARVSLKQASEHLKKLQSINKDLQTAKKNQAKLIAAHNDQAKMNGLIKDVADLFKSGEEAYNAAEDAIEDADSKL